MWATSRVHYTRPRAVHIPLWCPPEAMAIKEKVKN